MAKAKLAPDFDLPTDGGGRIKLSDLAGQKVVVYFYPKDDTSGCTLEAIDFTNAAKAFAKAGTKVIGISPDTEKAHDKFKAKHKLGVTLAADPEKVAIEAYGVWVEKSMYGRKYMGVERATFLIGPDRRIVQEWRKVRVPGHVEDVLAAAEAL
ncbi:MAG TPA: peroxiredoxin [Bauldia sp.]|nr:peroxiredoxin [Bauldia sp.]